VKVVITGIECSGKSTLAGQLNQEKQANSNGIDPIICDTSLLVIKIWSEIRFGRCHQWIIDRIARQDWDLFLLCDHHIPLEADPLRDYDLDRRINTAIETLATYK